jgi:hypothetical protein
MAATAVKPFVYNGEGWLPLTGSWMRVVKMAGWKAVRENKGYVAPGKYREDLIFVNPSETIAVNLIFVNGELITVAPTGKAVMANGRVAGWFGPCEESWVMDFEKAMGTDNYNVLVERLNAWLSANS